MMSNNLEQDWLNMQQDWQFVGDALRSAVHEVAGHLGKEALDEQVALITAAPDSVLGFPIPLGTVVHMRNGLPLSSRTVDEILVDYETDIEFEASHKRSLDRRSPPKYESRFVVNFLDDISEVSTAAVEKIDPPRLITNYLQLQAINSDSLPFKD